MRDTLFILLEDLGILLEEGCFGLWLPSNCYELFRERNATIFLGYIEDLRIYLEFDYISIRPFMLLLL